MPEDHQPEDYLHLPRADGGADAAKQAKAALWQQIAEKRRAKVSAESEASPTVMAEPESAPALQDEWAELLDLDPDAPSEALLPMQMTDPKPLIATPVEVGTRSDVSSKKRSIIRRTAPPVVEPDSGIVTQVFRVPQTVSSAVHIATPVDSDQQKPSLEVSGAEAAQESKSILTPTDENPPLADKTDALNDNCAPTPHSKSKTALRETWERWGGRSLAISVGIHCLIIGAGGLLVVNQGLLDEQVDFLPGGSQQSASASQELNHQIQQKKKTWLNKPVPMRKIAVNSISEIILPDEAPDLMDLPKSSDLLSSAKMGGLGGAGGGFGKSMGLGAKAGMVFQPLSMFGREIKAKRLALVLDVSSSMAPYLPQVIAELDKVAKGSIVILFPGCGLEKPSPRGLDGEELFRTQGSEFEKFWRAGGMASLEETRKLKFKPSDVIQGESVFRLLAKRQQTWFIHGIGTGYTWTALLSEQVRQADAIYWFSDFQDRVDFQQVLVVKENLLRRKQKLYIQPYQHGSSFDLVKSQLVDPTGGDVIEAVLE
jgi:hypothetical protein